MRLDPEPLLTAARGGHPRHLPKFCRYCFTNTETGRAGYCCTDQETADVIGRPVRQIQRWINDGALIPAGTPAELARVDEMAAAVGMHAYELWPELADAAVAEVERVCETCGDTFVLTRSDKRFCDATCRNASPARMARHRETSAAYMRERYWSDPEHRESRRAKRREDYAANPHPERLKQRLRDRAKREAA